MDFWASQRKYLSYLYTIPLAKTNGNPQEMVGCMGSCIDTYMLR